MKLGELFVDLGFDVDDQKLKDFNDKINGARNDLIRLSAVATGGVIALDTFLEKNAQAAIGIQNFTAQTGFSGEALQKWAAVIHETNPAVSIDQANESYKRLGQTLIDIRQGRGNSGALAMLGVTYNTNMTPEEVLDQIASHLNQQIAQYGVGVVSQKLDAAGIGAGALQALQLRANNPTGFDAYANQYVVAQQALEANRRFGETIADLDNKWRKFTMDLSANWAGPATEQIRNVTAAIKEWIPIINSASDALGGWKRIGEAILLWYAGTWALGMLATIGKVANALTLGAIGARLLAGAGAVAGGAAVVGAAAAPFVPYWLNKYATWGGKGWADHLADFIVPLDQNQGATPNPTVTRDDYGLEHFSTQPQAGNDDANRVSVTNNVTQHIHTTADARDTADEAKRILQEQNDEVYQQLNLGPTK